MKEILLGWPTIIYVLVAVVFLTVTLRFIQIRHFIDSCKFTLFPQSSGTAGDMTPFQAFINSLSASLGNGSIGGVAVAIYAGGPGAALWMLILGLLLMVARYSEIFLTTYFGSQVIGGALLGGPMVYLKKVSGGRFLAYFYAVICIFFGLIGGCAIQTNTMALSIATTWGIPTYVNALIFSALVAYIVCGGAHRIVRVSTAIVPVKVAIFFISSVIVLWYYHASLVPALILITKSAFSSSAVTGGLTGFTVLHAMRSGIGTIVFASEAGLGTAAIVYGGSVSKHPIQDSMSSMLGVFISTIVCFCLALMIVASGMWQNDLSSTALTVATFNTVFGQYGGWVVSFLSVSFGLGVLVTYAYITRAVWLYVTGGRGQMLFTIIYCLVAGAGSLGSVALLWKLADIVNVLLLGVNLFALLSLSPMIKRQLALFESSSK